MKRKMHLGLDVGGTNLVAGIVDDNYHIIHKTSMLSGADRPMEAILNDMVEVSRRAVSEAGLTLSEISSWGIGMPSCVNKRTGRLVHANCFGWKNIPIYDLLRFRLPIPLYIENDANSAVFGEALAGAARGHENVVLLTLGTGVGGGIVVDGKIFKGADHMGAELGHTKLIYNGELCTCGQRGCLEAYCSATALKRIGRKAVEEHPHSLLAALSRQLEVDGRVIFSAAADHDPTAEQILNDYVGHLAAGISTFITIFRPEIIVLGGGIASAGDQLLEPLRKEVIRQTFGAEQIGVPPIVAAQLGNDAGIIGAAFLELNN